MIYRDFFCSFALVNVRSFSYLIVHVWLLFPQIYVIRITASCSVSLRREAI